jgi:hypothetical protein
MDRSKSIPLDSSSFSIECRDQIQKVPSSLEVEPSDLEGLCAIKDRIATEGIDHCRPTVSKQYENIPEPRGGRHIFHRTTCLGGSAAPEQMEDKRDYGNNQNKMYKATSDMKSKPTGRPDTEQHEKQNQEQEIAKHLSLPTCCEQAKAHSLGGTISRSHLWAFGLFA